MNKMQLEQLWIYPVKSLPGVRMQSARVDVRGFVLDRHWMIVDKANGSFITQREYPSLALIGLELKDHKVELAIPGNGRASFRAGENSGETVQVIVWQDSLPALHVSPEVDQLLSGYLGKPVSLVEMRDDIKRQVDPDYAGEADQTGFSDGFPFLLIGQASLEDLNHRIGGHPVITMQRFRPNLVVTGSEAYAEDEWQHIQIGSISFRVVKPCSRCSITTVDPLTGERSAEPLRTLAGYRSRDNKVFFGQNLLHDQQGEMKQGDSVTVFA